MKTEDLPKKIAVLMGGPGSERDVSLATGRGVSKALRSLGADVVEVLTKKKFEQHGVRTPAWETIGAHERPRMQPPIVIKAPRQGSTVGVHIVKNAEEIATAISGSAKYDRELLIEKFVSGRELTIGILGDQALPILEIIPKGGFYDFTNKYPFLNPQAGGGAEHVCPARIDAKKTSEIQELALRAFRALGLQVYGRVDVILSDSGEPFVLEVNTIPGMTEVSLLPEGAAAAGIGYVDLCARIIELSRARTEGSRR
jgi:D-alanine-D-alanine ligase